MANRWVKMETVTDFIFLGSKITADRDCSYEIKRCLLLVRKSMTNLLLLSLSHFGHVWLCVAPIDGSPPGFSVHRILQTSILEWVAISFSHEEPRDCTEKHRQGFAYKGPSSQSYGFSSGHVWMLEFDQEEGWAPKNWCFQTVVLEKTLESPLDCKEIQPVNPKGNQSWIFIGRTDAEAEVPIVWPPDVKSQPIGKDPDAEKDWREKEKGVVGDEMVR